MGCASSSQTDQVQLFKPDLDKKARANLATHSVLPPRADVPEVEEPKATMPTATHPPAQSTANQGLAGTLPMTKIGSLSREQKLLTETLAVAEEVAALYSRVMLNTLLELAAAIDKDPGGRRHYSFYSITDHKLQGVGPFTQKEVQRLGHVPDTMIEAGKGYACKKGLKPDLANQDSFLLFTIEDILSIYGVFDGHGKKGHDVSDFVKEVLPKLLLMHPELLSNPQQALETAFEQTQQLVIKANKDGYIDAMRSGCTASIVLHNHKKSELYVAHVGDSRVVLGREKPVFLGGGTRWEALDLTCDHKPDLPEERQRIEENGGEVRCDGANAHRVYARGKGYPGLNMSRSLGDLLGWREAGLCAAPDVLMRSIVNAGEEGARKEMTGSSAGVPHFSSVARGNPPPSSSSLSASFSSHAIDPSQDRLLLLCSDGVWEFMSSQEAIEVAGRHAHSDPTAAALRLTGVAWDRWIERLGGQAVDDITALVIHLAPPGLVNAGSSHKSHPSVRG